jgi:hypothetical protein
MSRWKLASFGRAPRLRDDGPVDHGGGGCDGRTRSYGLFKLPEQCGEALRHRLSDDTVLYPEPLADC